MSDQMQMSTPTYRADRDEPTGWAGWAAFAGVMMIIGGTLNALYGLVAVANSNWVGWQIPSSAFLGVSTWGWIQVFTGLVVLAAGFGVIFGNVLARTVGVLVAAVSMVANFFFIPVYPLWAITILVVDALIIWALTAHGAELKDRA